MKIAEQYTRSVNSSSLADDSLHHSLDVGAVVAVLSRKEKARIRAAKWRAENPIRAKETVKNCYVKNGVAYRAARRIAGSTKERRDAKKIADSEYYSKNANHIKMATSNYYHANKEKVLIVCAAWRKANPEKVRMYAAKTRENNPETFRAQKQRRRAREMGAVGTLSKGLFKRLFALQKGMCIVCRAKLSSVKPRSPMDHIIALANGGANEDCNIQILCTSCNSQKHAKDPIDFMQSRGFLI